MKQSKFDETLDDILVKAKEILSRDITRKSFLKILAAFGAFLAFSSNTAKKAFAQNAKPLNPRNRRSVTTDFDLTAVTGDNIDAVTRKGVELLGGMGKFVRKGDVVVVKPNIGWNRTPEYAANTNPAVVASVIKMCFESGAKTVKVFDNPCNDQKLCYVNSGIMQAAKDAGATVFYMDDWKYAPAKFASSGALMNEWLFFKDAVDCDSFINVPIAKTHGLGTLTLSLKNMMGITGGNRSQIHWEMDKKLAEIYDFIKPDLNIIDAYNILTANGPRGGNLADVAKKLTVIASADPVLADSYASKTLFNINAATIPHIKKAADYGLGTMDIANARIKTLRI